jgi:hypothetical protein
MAWSNDNKPSSTWYADRYENGVTWAEYLDQWQGALETWADLTVTTWTND